jgi:hypothetical protein
MNIPKLPIQTKPVFWGVVAGAIALSIVGFNWGGWMTGNAAEKFARTRADAAVVLALTPICVDQFQKSAGATANLTALKEMKTTWDRRSYIAEGGWATLPGSTAEPNREVVAACAEELNKLVL